MPDYQGMGILEDILRILQDLSCSKLSLVLPFQRNGVAQDAILPCLRQAPVLQNSTRMTELTAFRGPGSVVLNTFATKTPSISLLHGPCVLKDLWLLDEQH